MKTRRGDSALTTIIALVILGVALYLVFPSWFTWLPTGGNSMGITLTINYVDGTSKVYNPYEKLTIGKLTITDTTGKPVSSISYTTNMRVTWTGTYQSHTFSGSASALIGTTVKQTTVIPSPTTLTSGTLVAIHTGSISSSTLRSWSVIGSNTLNIISSVTLTINFTDGTGSTLTGENTASWTYTAADWGITGLIVSVGITPILA